jgi:hypothetical protein
MTTYLNFFIRPLSPELHARTLAAHHARGIARYLSHPSNLPAVHPWAFLFTLGLSNLVKLHAHRDNHYPHNKYAVAKLLASAAYSWDRNLGEFSANTLHLCLVTLTPEQQLTVAENVEFFLSTEYKFLTKTERQHYMKPSDVVPADVMSRLEMSLASLETSLLNKDPMMPQHLRNTHSILIGYPETVHLLDDAEIARIIDAAEVHTKTEIVKAAASKKTAGPKVKLSAGDL